LEFRRVLFRSAWCPDPAVDVFQCIFAAANRDDGRRKQALVLPAPHNGGNPHHLHTLGSCCILQGSCIGLSGPETPTESLWTPSLRIRSKSSKNKTASSPWIHKLCLRLLIKKIHRGINLRIMESFSNV